MLVFFLFIGLYLVLLLFIYQWGARDAAARGYPRHVVGIALAFFFPRALFLWLLVRPAKKPSLSSC